MASAETFLNPRKKPRQARARATVSAILQAGAHILEEQGLQGFTTNAVAQRAGVSIGSLYQYFPAREALLAALIRQKRKTLLGALQTASAQSEGQDLTCVLRALIRAGTAHWQQRPALVRSLSYAEATLPMEEETRALKRAILQVVSQALANHAVPRPAQAARDLSALTYGMTDATGVFGPTEASTLETRILRAAQGYLGMAEGQSSLRNR
ncbi:TetR/AcrR family transcriptional regulator [Thalassobius sp. S69A]|uniref:TetR/AcrR family transcriptional regulator n=1 Tax=unclassified Thalassovita TaxID=2619711 RepID=UPI003C7B4FAA